MNKKKKNKTEEIFSHKIYKRIKQIFLIIVAIITYYQLYEYIINTDEIDITIENTKINGNKYKSLISLKNGTQPISSNDVIQKITLIFNDSINRIVPEQSKVKTKFISKKNIILLDFDLINKNEKIEFNIITKKRPLIKKIKFRIKGINYINKYHYLKEPKPINRILNIWSYIIILSVFFLIDAFSVVLKDISLGELKLFVRYFPLNSNNKKEFLKGYVKKYKKYKLRLKPDKGLMKEVINNLFIYFPYKTKKDFEFIKYMTNHKTEKYIFYRERTAFLMISPILIIVSFLAISLNYYYYDIGFLQKISSLNGINTIILRLMLFLTLFIIIYPRSSMNFFFSKRNAKHKF